MVTSVSCPTAETTGTAQAAMARATASSLKVQRSSSDPPPRPTITTSGPPGAAEIFDAAADLFHRAFALHQRREEPDVQAGKAARQDVDHVRDGRAARRGDDADAPRKARQRPFALRGEQPLGGQLLLELLEGQLQRAQALRLQRLHQQLVFAARLVDVDAAARQHRQPVLRLELPVAVRRSGRPRSAPARRAPSG